MIKLTKIITKSILN